MDSIFIAGNGFDLAHGIPSKYSDFRKYLLKKYPDVEAYVNLQFDLYQYSGLTEIEFAIQLLFLAMDNTIGAEWCDFENALGDLNFDSFFPRRTDEEKNLDDRDELILYLKYCYSIISLIKPINKQWQKLFTRWVKSIEKNIPLLNIKAKDPLNTLFSKRKDFCFLNFNYTLVLEKVYHIKNVTHIHNKVGESLVVGHGSNDTDCFGSGMIMSSELDDFASYFKKNTDFQMKKYASFFNDIDKNINKVYSYGFSYSNPDKQYILEIIRRISPQSTWYFTKFEASDSEQIRIKKIKLRKYGFKGDFGVF